MLGAPTHEPATLFANSAFLLLARFFTLASGGLLIVYAIRTFSVESFGEYSIAVALITIFTSLSEMGISTLAVREIAEGRPAGQILGISIVAEVLASVAAVVAMLPIAYLLGYSDEVLTLLLIGSAIVLLQGFLAAADAVFKARRILVYIAAFTFVQSAVAAVLGFVLVALGAGPVGLMSANTVALAVTVPIALGLLAWKLDVRPHLEGALRRAIPFLRVSAPIALLGAVTVAYERVDVLLVAKIDSSEAAATYSVPLTIVQYTLLVPAVVGTAFFPLLASTLSSDASSARTSFFLLARLFILGSVPIAIFFAVASPELVPFVFGERYEDSAAVLTILSLSVVLGFLIYLLWYALLAAHRERTMAGIMLVVLPVNLLLNVLLIPSYGPKGAAFALMATDVLIIASQVALIHRSVFQVPVRELLAKPIVAVLACVPIVLLLWPVSRLLAGTAGAAAFFLVSLLTRYVSGREWEPITGPLADARRRVRARLARSEADS